MTWSLAATTASADDFFFLFFFLFFLGFRGLHAINNFIFPILVTLLQINISNAATMRTAHGQFSQSISLNWDYRFRTCGICSSLCDTCVQVCPHNCSQTTIATQALDIDLPQVRLGLCAIATDNLQRPKYLCIIIINK